MTLAGEHLTGFGARVGFGRRPALVVVDMSAGFVDPRSPLGCRLDEAIAAIGTLLVAARRAGMPVIYTTVAYGDEDRSRAAALLAKVPALAALESRSAWVEIDRRIAPARGEVVLTKLFASAFFGTALQSLLVADRADTLVVTGASTSGCVRATVVDAVQRGFRVVVPEGAVGDRDPLAHRQSLRDIDAKYGDVIAVDDVLSRIQAYGETP